MAEFSERMKEQMLKFPTFEAWRKRCGSAVEDVEKFERLWERAHGLRRPPGRPPKED